MKNTNMPPKKNVIPWQQKAIKLLLVSLCVLIPIIWSRDFYSEFAGVKLFSLRIITVAILFLWAWLCYEQKKIIWRKGKIYWFVATFALSLVISTIFSTSIWTSLFGIETRFLGLFTQLNFLLLIILAYNFLTSKRDLILLSWVSFMTAVGISIYGLFQGFGIIGKELLWSQDIQARIPGTMGHSVHFAAYMAMHIAHGFGILLNKFQRKNVLKKIGVSVGMLSLFIALLFSGSRGALIALIITLPIIAGFIIARRSKNKISFIKQFSLTLSIFMVTLAIIGFAFTQLSHIPVFQRIQETIQSTQNGYIPDRLSWWLSSLQMITHRPIFGFGVSTFNDTYNTYRRTDYRVPGPGDVQNITTPESSHMEYLDIAVQQGIIGLFAYLALVGFVFVKLMKSLRNPELIQQDFALGIGILGVVFVYYFQAFFNFGVVDILVGLFLILGAAGSFAEPEKYATFALNEGKKLIFTILACAIIVFVGIGTFQEAKAEILYRQALTKAAQGNFQMAEDYFSVTTKTFRYRYEFEQGYANFMAKAGYQFDTSNSSRLYYISEAIHHYKTAIALNSHHPSLYANLGTAYYQRWLTTQSQEDLDNSKKYLQEAVLRGPNNPLYQQTLNTIFDGEGVKIQ